MFSLYCHGGRNIQVFYDSCVWLLRTWLFCTHAEFWTPMLRKKTHKHFHCKCDHLKNWRLLKLWKKYAPHYAGNVFFNSDCITIVNTPCLNTQIHTCGETARSVRRARYWQIWVRAGGQLVSRLERPGMPVSRGTFLFFTALVPLFFHLFVLLFCVCFQKSLHSGKISHRRGDYSGKIGYWQCAGGRAVTKQSCVYFTRRCCLCDQN